jgi:hypothetical protein
MTFTWLNKQGVRSSEGFEVQCTGRFTIEYREGRRIRIIDVEPVTVVGKPGIGIKANTFERWDHSFVPNSPGEQERLLSNFRAAMEFQGMEVEV